MRIKPHRHHLLLLALVCGVALIPGNAWASSPRLRVVDKHVSLADNEGRFFIHVRCADVRPCSLRYMKVTYRGHQLTYGVGRARARIGAGHVARVRVSHLASWAVRMLKRHHRLSVLMTPLSTLPASSDQGATSRVALFP